MVSHSPEGVAVVSLVENIACMKVMSNYAANCNPCILILYKWQIILFVICNSPESAVPEKITFGSLTVIMQ